MISGEFRGRKLAGTKGLGTRPTSDRVKEALFNLLYGYVEGAVVLDLFAGTGSLGIEAMSRGARKGVLIDHHPDAIRVIHQNILYLGLAPKVDIIRWDIIQNLHCLNRFTLGFDLIFMDPPYFSECLPKVLAHLLHMNVLAPDARIAVEHHAKESHLALPSGFFRYDHRIYGQTGISLLVYEQSES